jgi:RecJ-like exonuclease
MTSIKCNACNGSGKYLKSNARCFRCMGKGHQTDADVTRNATYDKHHNTRTEPKAVRHFDKTLHANVYVMSQAASDKYQAALVACKSNKRSKAYRTLHENVAQALAAHVYGVNAPEIKVECRKGNNSTRWYVKVTATKSAAKAA